ncbi:transposase-like protein [Bradyrhizobium sp. LB14.3]
MAARETAQDWRDLLLDLKRRGLDVAPRLVIADGALGLWNAAGEVWPCTSSPSCRRASSRRPNAHGGNQGCRRAGVRRLHRELRAQKREGRRLPEQVSGHATGVLRPPAQHRKHLRTPNPIESTFGAVRHRIIRSKGRLSNRTALALVFRLLEAEQKSWRRLDGHNQLPKTRCRCDIQPGHPQTG